jgi:hypothetical protein
MKFALLSGLLAAGCGIVSAQAGADFYLKPAIGELQLQAHFIFYGDGIKSESASLSTEEISRMWSENLDGKPFTVRLAGVDYSLRAQTTYEIVTIDQAKAIAKTNTDPGIQFIRIEKGGNPGDRSYYYLGGNTGVFYESDELGVSTTAAHEFGHGLGLPHPDKTDWRGLGQPPVMLPRGCLVDKPYQWDPNADAGKAGGTVRPHLRKVIQFDVDALELSQNLHFDANGRAPLGSPTNQIIEAGVNKAKGFPSESGWIE